MQAQAQEDPQAESVALTNAITASTNQEKVKAKIKTEHVVLVLVSIIVVVGVVIGAIYLIKAISGEESQSISDFSDTASKTISSKKGGWLGLQRRLRLLHEVPDVYDAAP